MQSTPAPYLPLRARTLSLDMSIPQLLAIRGIGLEIDFLVPFEV